MKSILFFILNLGFLSSAHSTNQFKAEPPFQLDDIIANYSTETITGPVTQGSLCQLGLFDGPNSLKKLVFKSWFFDSREGEWFVVTNGIVESEAFEEIFTELYKAKPTTSENVAATNSIYLEVIDRRSDPIVTLPVYGTGRKNVYGVDVNTVMRLRNLMDKFCGG